MADDPKNTNRDPSSAPSAHGDQKGGSSPSGRPDGKSSASKSQGGPQAPRGGSDDDQDAGKRTAPGKPKEFDETVRRNRGEEQADQEAADE